MRKKEIVTMLISVTVCLALAGCGSNAGAATASQEAQTQEVQETAADTVAETVDASAGGETEGEVDVALDDGIDLYEGSWYEEIAGRGSMDISPSGDGKYYIEVVWGNSVAESAMWEFTAIYDSATGDLVYDDGDYKTVLFDENGDETVEEEKSVHGVLHLNDDGKIEWTDSAPDSSEPSIFVK